MANSEHEALWVRASKTTAIGGPYTSPGGIECPACHGPIEKGQAVTVVPLGPGADPQDRERAARNDAFDAVGVQVHYVCGFGEEASDHL